MHVEDPIQFAKMMWPENEFYDKEVEVVRSVQRDDETMCPAGNMLGKDYIAGFIATSFFLQPWMYFPREYSRNLTYYTVRVVTTSVKDDHLRVLWGEIGRWMQSCRYPLDVKDGGPLIINHRDVRRVVNGKLDEMSYLRGMVSMKGEGMAGHHAAYTLFIADEASGVDDNAFIQADTWAKRRLVIGNCNPCINHFYRGVEAGSILKPSGTSYYRNVIRIKAEDSPNVQFALRQKALGIEPTDTTIVQGVISWSEYCRRRLVWDPVRQCIGLDAAFWKGAQQLLFPPEWLNRAESLFSANKSPILTIGCDSGEGRANTTWSFCNELGVRKLVSMKTPDTNVIPGLTIGFMREHKVAPEHVGFDRGGGGLQHADRIRAMGYPVRTIGFGEPIQQVLKHGRQQLKEKKTLQEERYAYKNRRAQMYHELSLLMDPVANPLGYCIPSFGPEAVELRKQLAVMPKLVDEEGRYWMLPKNKKDPNSNQQTLTQLIGHSPDEADAAVVGLHVMLHKQRPAFAGAVG